MRLRYAKAADHTDVNRAEHDTGIHTDEALWDMIVQDAESCQ